MYMDRPGELFLKWKCGRIVKPRFMGVEHKTLRCRLCKQSFESRYISDQFCIVCSPFKSQDKKWRTTGRDAARYLCRLRDKFSCQECGEVRLPKNCGKGKKFEMSLDVHHINGECGKKSRGYDSTKDISGLITLCHRCHSNRHDHSKNN